MYDSIKTTKRAKLIFYFIDENEEKGPQSLTILEQKRIITNEQNKYEIELEDKSINENIIYKCFLQYESEKIVYYIKVYYGQENYYVFGRKKNNMCFEFIFTDFLNKNIDNNKCFITYNGKKYFAFDDKNFLSLRCLNLINIDLNLLELPVSYENKVISKSVFDNSSFFIFVSVSEEVPKIFGIHFNKPFVEKEFKLTANEIVQKLNNSLGKVQSVLNYDKNYKTYEEYFNHVVFKNVPTIYLNEIRNSVKLEEEILPFFSFYRPNLTNEEIMAFEAYSNFMIAFPSFRNKNRLDQKLNTHPFIQQYYYSRRVIENFIKTIPSSLSRAERTLLIYSACRCLRNLLNSGLAMYVNELFYFCDLNESDNIYKEAREFNEKFIENLTEKSEMFPFLLQINSGSSINKLTNDLTARISMLKIEQIKKHLRDSLPNYIIRVKHNCGFKGLTFNEAKCTVISEIDLFGYFFDEKELKEDITYNKRLIISNVLQHERFGHIKFSMNFFSFKQDKVNNLIYANQNIYEDDEPSSPRQYYRIKQENNQKYEDFIEVVYVLENIPGKKIEIGESGLAFNVFLTRGDEENLNILRNDEADFSKIFKQPELFASEDLSTLNALIKESASQSEGSITYFKKVSEEKYEHSAPKTLYIDKYPTVAKYDY